ncbi:hypothetical protein [Primorskyibacter sp. S87]|uniref:hypothetical protein n=1 Tax=Primorskyibacter sp. S87 TaxID=3415126 RepID=UPI003C7DD448
MQVIFHTGAHATDEDRLQKTLLRNKEAFAASGIAVPGPGKYRKLLKDCFEAMESAPLNDDARDVLIDAILDDEQADRLILSNQFFFGTQRAALEGDQLYPGAAERVAQMQSLFAFDQVEIFMAIRNPATFLPAAYRNASPRRLQQIQETTDPRALRWSEMIERVRAHCPDVPLTVWCNEDTPLIWAQIIREMAGLNPGEKIIGGFDLLSQIMSPEGMKRFRAYLKTHRDMSEMHKRRVIAAFLDKFALEDEVEEELDLPGWTEDLVDDMTEIYDEDVFRIQRIPGVQFIEP